MTRLAPSPIIFRQPRIADDLDYVGKLLSELQRVFVHRRAS